jgi:hypothetical protein
MCKRWHLFHQSKEDLNMIERLHMYIQLGSRFLQAQKTFLNVAQNVRHRPSNWRLLCANRKFCVKFTYEKGLETVSQIANVSGIGLPDFSCWRMIPKLEKMYQMNKKCTRGGSGSGLSTILSLI